MPLTGEGLLLDISKISIAVAGFAGVVMAFRHSRDAVWKANEVAALKLLVGQSFGAVFFGLLPSIVALHWQEPLVWQWCSFLLGLFIIYGLLSNSIQLVKVFKMGRHPRKIMPLLIEYFGFGMVLLCIQTINAIVWCGAFAYALAVVWLLFTACRQFRVCLLDVPQETPSEPNDTKHGN